MEASQHRVEVAQAGIRRCPAPEWDRVIYSPDNACQPERASLESALAVGIEDQTLSFSLRSDPTDTHHGQPSSRRPRSECIRTNYRLLVYRIRPGLSAQAELLTFVRT